MLCIYLIINFHDEDDDEDDDDDDDDEDEDDDEDDDGVEAWEFRATKGYRDHFLKYLDDGSPVAIRWLRVTLLRPYIMINQIFMITIARERELREIWEREGNA